MTQGQSEVGRFGFALFEIAKSGGKWVYSNRLSPAPAQKIIVHHEKRGFVRNERTAFLLRSPLFLELDGGFTDAYRFRLNSALKSPPSAMRRRGQSLRPHCGRHSGECCLTAAPPRSLEVMRTVNSRPPSDQDHVSKKGDACAIPASKRHRHLLLGVDIPPVQLVNPERAAREIASPIRVHSDVRVGAGVGGSIVVVAIAIAVTITVVWIVSSEQCACLCDRLRNSHAGAWAAPRTSQFKI